METDRLVDDYLRRLEAAAAHLQRARRTELVAEIREHIETALRQEEEVNEIAVRNVLERLGPPDEIVEAVEPPPTPAEMPRRARALEITALIALLVPVIGWLVGTVLVAISRAWTGREKMVGIGLLLVAVLLPALGLSLEGASNTDQEPVPPADRPVVLPESGDDGAGPVELTILLFLFGWPSALYLGWRLARRPGVAAHT